MNNPISPDPVSEVVVEEEETWSVITATPSSPLSDTDGNSSSSSSSWVLISDIALEENDADDDNNDDKEDLYSQKQEEEEEEDDDDDAEESPPSSTSSSSLPNLQVVKRSDQKLTCSSSSENLLSVILRERVLHRLPAKQLLHLRTVCRRWNDFITSPFLIQSQSQSSTSISGVFYIHSSSPIHKPLFNPFGGDLHGVGSPELKFLPEPVAVLSSSRGLLCCKSISSTTTRYFIVNPLTGSWVMLPPPANDHGPSPAAVIVFDEPFTFNFCLDYKVVVAYDLGGCYGFEVFRSREWEWGVSAGLCVTERIEPESGVAAGGCAHWRTTMQTVVSYDPEVDRNWDVVWPESYSEDVVWELGEIGGRLSCVCVKGSEVCVYASEGSGWKEVRKVGRKWSRWVSGEVRVVRVQEVREVVVVDNGKVWKWGLEDGKWSEGDWYVGEGCDKFVSFVGSLLHAYGTWG